MAIKTKKKQYNAIEKATPARSILRQILLFSIIIAAIICAYFVLQQQMQRFAITSIKVQGQIVRTSQLDIRNSITNLVNKGFFYTNVNTIRVSLQKLPWIASAKVEKIWPDKLSILINEKIPIARWRGKGLVTTEGDIVYSNLQNDADKLPVFWGKEQESKKVLENYITMSKILKQQDLSVVEIEIMPDHGVRVILSNGIILFVGQEGLRERLNRFTLAYQNKLQKISHKIDYIDLRYVSGISVGWKDSTAKL